MTVLDNKILTNKINLISSKFILSLLLLLVATFISCRQEEKITSKNIYQKEEVKGIDSLTIILTMPKKTSTGISTVDKFLNFKTIKFSNKSDSLKKVVKSIPKYYNTLSLHHLFFYNADVINQFYFIDKHTDTIELDLGAKYRIKDHKKNADNIYHDYQKLANKIKKNKKKDLSELKIELDSLSNFYNKKYEKSQEEGLRQLNNIHHYQKLQSLYPNDKKIDSFIYSLKESHASIEFRSLLINYMKNRVNQLDYITLNNRSYENKQVLALAHFNFLNLKKNKGKKQYKPAIQWLTTTDLYKNDSLYIKKEVTPLSNAKFKNKLNRLMFFDTIDKKSNLKQIIKKHSSPYYLIDFWATWCAPCIEGVKEMQRMNIPKNVKVISLSLDKTKDKGKWKIKTKELEQSITYWLDETSEEVKVFLKFIELQSIPRYILIDKNMNLIDQDFYSPKESQFLPKLQDVKNYKYW